MKWTRKIIMQSICLLAVIIGLSMVIIAAIKSSDEISSTFFFVEDMKGGMRLFRWTFLVLIVAAWEKLIDIYSIISKLSDQQIEYGKSLQWRVAIMLVSLDLLVIEELPMRLIG